MQSVFATITKLIPSKNYFCKAFFCNNFGRNGTGAESRTGPGRNQSSETLLHVLRCLESQFAVRNDSNLVGVSMGTTRLGATGPAALRGKWHSERGSERVSERVLGDL